MLEKLSTLADIIHPDIHMMVGGGQDGPRMNANPNGANDRGGEMHGIANVPGQSGESPGDDGVSGWANTLEDRVHGGIDVVNKVAAEGTAEIELALKVNNHSEAACEHNPMLDYMFVC